MVSQGPDVIYPTSDYLQVLRDLVHDAETLSKHGYILQQLSPTQLEGYKRCGGCGKQMKSFKREELIRPTGDKQPADQKQPAGDAQRTPKIHCKFHTGNLVAKQWTCCGKPPSADLCSGQQDHSPAPSQHNMKQLYQLYPTPSVTVGGSKRDIRTAVAIDCEMGQAVSGDRQLIRVTVIDYFTGALLIDRLVWPDVELLHPNTRYSGVTWKDLNSAQRSRTCLFGISNARQAVWNFVGPETVVVGHSANNDLTSLRWLHPAVVDSFIIEWILQTPIREAKIAVAKTDTAKERAAKALAAKEKVVKANAEKEQVQQAETETEMIREETGGKEQAQLIADDPTTNETPTNSAHAASTPGVQDKGKARKKSKGSGELSLKSLALTKLGRNIQNAGKAGHDSFEDALATRDLVHWYICNSIAVVTDTGDTQDRQLVSSID